MRRWALAAVAAGLATLAAWPAAAAPAAAASPGAASPAVASAGAAISPITEFSRCRSQNAEVEEAVDSVRGYVYQEWMGCGHKIGFATSADGGVHFGNPVVLAYSYFGWDPSVAVAPDGTVYAAFMHATNEHQFPVVEASFNHGQSFSQVTSLVPAMDGNFGDRDFLTVGPAGTLYLTWDYGPSASGVKLVSSRSISPSFIAGDLNIVMQTSADGGRTWTPMVHVSSGFPAGGADSAPLLMQPDGRVDVEYQGYRVTSRTKLTLGVGHSYFTSSADGGQAWTRPIRIGPDSLTMSRSEWWIDGAIGADSAGNLYVTWDTQGRDRDIGWLSYSTNKGRTWSAPLRVTPDTDDATHIVEVAGGGSGLAYVGWLADNSARGYALYLRPFSVAKGWLTGPVRVSRAYGTPKIWPGDTFGISTEPAALTGPQAGWPRVVVSWGSAVGGKNADSEDRAAIVAFRQG